jgi:hypothetical protein
MDLVPQTLVVGIYTPVPLPGGEGRLTRAQINGVWADVTAKYDGYHQLQIAADGASAQFLGPGEGSAVTIQPPLLQVLDDVHLTAAKSAEKAQDVLATVARGIGAHQFFNAGIKYVAHADAPDQDARAFLLHRVLAKTDADLADLSTGGTVLPGLSYYVLRPESMFKILVEPLLADQRKLYIEIETQFQGPIQIEQVLSRCTEVLDFMQGSLTRHLDSQTG